MAALILPTTAFTNGTVADADLVTADLLAVQAYVNGSVVRVDGTNAMTARLLLFAADPTNGNHAVRKSYMDGSYVHAQSGIAQSFTTNTYQVLKFASEVDDRSGEYNLSTGIFTATKAGVYSVTFSIEPDQSYNSLVRMRIVTTNDIFYGPLYVPLAINSINEAARQQCHADVLLAAGETIQPQLAYGTTASQDDGTFLTIAWLHG